jgi:PAS domain S-box-containing protein
MRDEEKTKSQLINELQEMRRRVASFDTREKLLQESERKYRVLVEQSLEGLAIARGYPPRFVFVNRALSEMLGYTVDELLSLSDRNTEHLMLPEERAIHLARYAQRLNGEPIVTRFDLRAVRKDGAIRWFEAASNRIEYEGQPAVQVILIDITERKQAEESLRESEERYRQLFASTHDGVIIARADGKIISANPAAAEMMRCASPEELERMNTYDFYADPGARERVIQQLKERGYVDGIELRARRKDGDVGTFLATLTPQRDRDGRVVHVAGLIKEITERKRAEEALASERKRLAVTLESIADSVLAIDPEGRVTLMNAAAEQLTGWAQEEAVEKPLGDVLHLVDLENGRQGPDPVSEVMKSKQDARVIRECSLVARDGSERTIAYTASPIRDSKGGSLGVVLALRDITEKRRMEREFLRDEKLESVSVLAGGIAHDFNNILTAATGNLFLAKMHAGDNSALLGDLAGAEQAILQAIRLTQQLLVFSKSGVPVKKAASVSDVLRQTVEFALSGSNVACRFTIPDDLWVVEMDVAQIGQVISNITINAVQAMPEGGALFVSAANRTLTKSASFPLEDGEYVAISIRDEGIGIPKEDSGRIFDPYFTTKPTGTGLGLAASRIIVERHGGHITFESTLGIGTTFHLYLPGSDKQVVSQESAPDIPIPGRGRILLVDDEEMIRHATSEVLEQLGYEVDVAVEGNEAIERYAAARESGLPYDAVILDLTTAGGAGGRATMEKLLKMDPAVKALVSSGYATDPIMADHRAYGFCGVIAKPYRGEELSRELHRVLSVRED